MLTQGGDNFDEVGPPCGVCNETYTAGTSKRLVLLDLDSGAKFR
jgi:hypothetical protein